MCITNREKEILYWASCGYSAKEIAAKIFLSPYTVNDHIKSLRSKMNASNTPQLIRRGFEEGLLHA